MCSAVTQEMKKQATTRSRTLIIRECVKTKTRNADIIDVFSPDTDVLVLLVGHSSKIVPRLNMVLSPTNTIKYVAAILGEDKCNTFIGLHAVTGCDTTGKMFKKSKKTWVNEFLVSNMAVVTSLRDLTTEDSTEKSITGIEKLFARVYCPQTKLDSVSQAKVVFVQTTRRRLRKTFPNPWCTSTAHQKIKTASDDMGRST